ncbi:HET domain-containing protein [Dactylonectria macrodidyma]|uniref:HET domain-containing protein n=1 Tax=Dactylonectria macrodidyma TaxID=307937 RepID=A0A9P9D1Z7_9HYPO|nr:HET domain-containing protein [Dactylonectria macrodidyma]
MTAPRIYKPLDTGYVRLFRLDDRTSSGDISGSLVSVRLKDAPPYFTLSYCWGTEEFDIPIRINDSVIYVSPSLAAAIRRLQELDASEHSLLRQACVEWMWIDRVCINQNDTSERGKQVQLMGSIFSKAVRTLIWLGTDYDACSAAWTLVDQIFNVFSKESPQAKFVADIPFRIYSDVSHTASGLPNWNHDLWRHLTKLLQRPWFTRVWVIQEVVLSHGDPLILHGQQIYPWHRLGWAASWLRRSGYLRLAQVPNQMLNVDMISNIRRSERPWNLDALLVATSAKSHATDQRDKVYGLLGLATECQDPGATPPQLRVDYSSTVPEVYEKVASFLVHKYKSLAILTRTRGLEGDICRTQRKHDFSMLPSWVPDWSDFTVSEREVAKSLSWLFHSGTSDPDTLGFPDHYEAAGKLPARLTPSDPVVLRLGGLITDNIVSVTPFTKELQSTDSRAQVQAQGAPMLIILKLAASLTGKPVGDWIESFIMATTANQSRISGRTAEQLLKDGSSYLLHLLLDTKYKDTLSHFQRNDQDLLAQLRTLSIGGDASSYIMLARNFCLNRTFFITSNQRMGIGPSGTRPGDCVAVILGGGVPCVLRRRDRGFLFVGESYLHGIMKGEAILAWKNGKIVEEIVELW